MKIGKFLVDLSLLQELEKEKFFDEMARRYK